MTTQEINAKRLAQLSPGTQTRVKAFIAAAAADGVTLEITQGLRTVAEQDALYAKGRTAPGPPVTKARGGHSYHNYGLAADLAPVVDGVVSFAKKDDHIFDHFGKWADAAGLEWGGRWKSITDRPHVQLPKLPVTKLLLAVFQAGGLAAVWRNFGG